MIEIKQATVLDKQVLRNLMQLYKYDFTTYDPEDVDEFGLYDYPYLDYYFVEEDRFAYLIRVEGVLAGFALIRHTHLEANGEAVIEFAEFFILKKYRRNRIGSQAADAVLSKHNGKWKIAVMYNNTPAMKFWKNLVSKKVDTNYKVIKESDWQGDIFVFEVKSL